jgi:MFS transporter, DHA2 family, multidrug resistance protein
MLCNLGGVLGTVTLATVSTKREQFHSRLIGQSVTLDRDEARRRLAEITNIPFARHVRSGDCKSSLSL